MSNYINSIALLLPILKRVVLIFLISVIMPFDGNTNPLDNNNENVPKGWYVDGKLVPPQCLPRPFISEDNFESFANYYKIDVSNFEKEPGKYFGNPIKDLNFLPDHWAAQVISHLDACGDGAETPVVQADGHVISGQMPDAESYKILGKLKSQECNKLIPHYPVKPELCYAINITEYMSGSMGSYSNNYIYGLVREQNKNYILPLLSLFDDAYKATDEERAMACVLKNVEFCGVWQDTKGKDVIITGDKIIYKYYDSTDTCRIMKEARLEDGRPLSLLICNIPSTEPGLAYTSGYMLVMMLQDDLDKRINSHSVHMLMLGDPDPANPCFSDDTVKKQSCNLPDLYEQNKESGHETFAR